MATIARGRASPHGVDDATLRGFAGYRLKRALNRFRTDLARVLEPCGLRMLTYSALVLIVDNPGLRPSQLADALAIERPNVAVLVDELEERGLAKRERDPTDRRAYALTATLKGQQLCARAVAANTARETALLAGIPASKRTAFLDVLAHLSRTDAGERR